MLNTKDVRKYSREDIDYHTFYNAFMRNMAKNYSIRDLKSMLNGYRESVKKSTASKLMAIERTSGMQSHSQARAHAGNAVATAGSYISAIEGAIEIHELFPEHT